MLFCKGLTVPASLLPSDKIDLDTAVILLKSLKVCVQSLRNRFDEFERDGIQRTSSVEYSEQNRRVRRANVRLNPLDYGHAPEVQRTPKERFIGDSFLPVIYLLLLTLSDRISAYDETCSRFGFIRQLVNLITDELKISSANFYSIYSMDLEESLGEEMVQFQPLIALFLEEKEESRSIERFMYEVNIGKNLKSTFPNVEMVLRRYLSLMVLNCSGERSFSQLIS